MNNIKKSKISESNKQDEQPYLHSGYVELHVEDFDVVEKFYTQLGFETVWKREPEGFKGYMVMKLENNIIAFWGGNTEINNHPFFKNFNHENSPGYRVELVFFTKHLKELYEKCIQLNCVYEELQTWPWGKTDFRIKDPNGFYIRLTEEHNVLSDENAVV